MLDAPVRDSMVKSENPFLHSLQEFQLKAELNVLTLEVLDVPVSGSVMKVISGLMLTRAVGMKLKVSTWP